MSASSFGKARPHVASPVAQSAATRIAAVQMASGPNVEGNLNEARRLVEKAANGGAKLVALPEYFAIMGLRDQDKVRVREKAGGGPIQDFLSATAKKHKIWLAGGSVPLECSAPDKVRNSCLIYDDKGRLAARYDKIHLFGFEMGQERYSEERTIEPGKDVVTVDSPFGKLGISICYDLRFPELYRAMKPVDIILIPSAFTETTGRAHWETLIRARAIENLAYVLAPAQGGYHVNGRETHGDSMIVDPWGVVLDRLTRGSGVVAAGVNLDHLRRLRESLPALTHRTLYRC
ncbi:MAG: carbon-nitrogen hydrolase family protein [Betaproteobacteria bacterium]|nr:carbon-nitrogen hydrolase family protein [Betaproteobacteria bacterium]MBI2509355.1 carbon-nitrogen hydrolase family protein [Betaproteobacteria bacterium]